MWLKSDSPVLFVGDAFGDLSGTCRLTRVVKIFLKCFLLVAEHFRLCFGYAALPEFACVTVEFWSLSCSSPTNSEELSSTQALSRSHQMLQLSENIQDKDFWEGPMSQIQVTCPPPRVSKEQSSLKSFPGMNRKEDKQGLPSAPWLGFYPCSLSTCWVPREVPVFLGTCWVPRAVPVFSKHMLCAQVRSLCENHQLC